jgi:hypothetical protein
MPLQFTHLGRFFCARALWARMHHHCRRQSDDDIGIDDIIDIIGHHQYL